MKVELVASKVCCQAAQADLGDGASHAVVCHPDLPAGLYQARLAYRLSESAHNLRRQVGDRVIELSGVEEGFDTVYVFAQAVLAGVYPNAIGVSPLLFDLMWEAAEVKDLEVRVTRKWVLLDTTLVEGPQQNIPLCALSNFKEHLEPSRVALRRSALPSWTVPAETGRDGDQLFAENFPEVPSLYKPHSLLSWFAWLMHCRDSVDRSHDGPVSGFDGASAQRIDDISTPSQSQLKVELLNEVHQVVGGFVAMLEGADVRLTTASGHHFFIKGTVDAPILFYTDGTTAFSWDGQAHLKIGAPKAVLSEAQH